MPPLLDEEEEEYHGDTIVVKGEYPAWSRVSTPNSLSPEIDVANLLAQINAPQNLDYPQQLQDPDSNDLPTPHYRPQTRVTRTPKSRLGHKVVITTMEDRLMAMPEKRPLPWRDGVEAGAENETGGESRRKQIRFGCLLATRGEIQENPCVSCAKGSGKFRVCVALDGYFKGACASCQLSGRPNRCSIKKGDDDGESPAAAAVLDTPSGQDSSMLSIRQQATPSDTAPKPAPKKRKTAKADKANTAAEAKIPEWESARPQWEQELGDAHARQQQQRQQQQMNEIVQRPWAPVNDGMGGINGINVIRTIPQEQQQQQQHRNSMGGWAAVNNAPTPTPQGYGNISDSTGSFRGRQNSVREQARREETYNDDGGVALIDTLPKNKQRQVYGLVSGLQNGIQGLQRELDSLKKALGIDED